MDLTLDYTNKSNKIKSQISAGVIGLRCEINNHSFDLNQATDHIINIQLSDAYEYITNIRINVKHFNSKDLLDGIFNLPTSNNIIQVLKPGIYYLELWVDTENGRFIFPSEGQLKLDLMSNSINGSDSVSSIAADQMKDNVLNWNALLDQKIQELKHLIKHCNQPSPNMSSNDSSNNVSNVVSQNARINQSYFNQINQNEEILRTKESNNAVAADTYYNQNAASIHNILKTISQLKDEISTLQQNRND